MKTGNNDHLARRADLRQDGVALVCCSELSPGRPAVRGFLFFDLGHGYLAAQRWPHVETLDCFCKGIALVVGVDGSEVL